MLNFSEKQDYNYKLQFNIDNMNSLYLTSFIDSVDVVSSTSHFTHSLLYRPSYNDLNSPKPLKGEFISVEITSHSSNWTWTSEIRIY